MADINTPDIPATVDEALDKAKRYLTDLIGLTWPDEPFPNPWPHVDGEFAVRQIAHSVYNVAQQNNLPDSDMHILLAASLGKALAAARKREMEAALRALTLPFMVVTKE
jgi:hypothetical protein